jgi:large subunit ribosomal protein L17
MRAALCCCASSCGRLTIDQDDLWLSLDIIPTLAYLAFSPSPYSCSSFQVYINSFIMRKRLNFRKLSRTPSHKWAMLRNLVTSLIEHERIVTTTPKAKEVQSLAEKLITKAKGKDQLHARRQINTIVRTATEQTKLMNVLGPRYEFREGGYTRILKLANPRAGDNADMAVLEYVDRPGEIRAARPPSIFQGKVDSLEDVMRQLGISEMPSINEESKDVSKESS